MALPEGFNWFLILIAVIVSLLVLGGCIHILIQYQHPEDNNQAWIPKIVVVFGLSLAILTVLMFPLDIANKAACSSGISPSACKYTMPMYTLWMAAFVGNLVMVFAICPFTLFFYEADSDFTFFQKVKSALGYTIVSLIFIGLVIGILYALFGYVIYPTQKLQSGTVPLTSLQDLSGNYGGLNYTKFACVPTAWLATSPPTFDAKQCDAFGPNITLSNWKLRVSLPVYIMAVQSVIGWLFFLIFAGVGMLSAPIDWIQQFLGRPTSVITKSEYIRRAQLIAQRAKQVMSMSETMRKQDKDRKWRSNYKRLEREVLQLEEDEFQLERVYPQGEDGEVRWVLFMLGFYVTGFMGVTGICLSLAWMVHIVVYMFPPVPLYPMLNNLFVVLDGAFSLLGVAAFAGFCLYMMVIAMKGNFMLGMNLVFVKLYPMRPGATLMSSFLFNTAIILLMAPPILQFCATAFAVYGHNSDIFDIFGNQVMYLQGISWLYTYNLFLYAMFAVIFLSSVFMCFRGRKQWERKRDKFDVYADLG